MDSLVCIMPGSLQFRTDKAPVLAEGQAILRIKRVGICGTDFHAFRGTQPFFEYPRIMGHELAADVVEADTAPGFRSGDPVTVIPYFSCGHCIACLSGRPNCCARLKVLGVHIDGGMSEYISVPSASLVSSDGLSYDELAMVEPLSIGAHAVRRAGVSPGQFVLVMGAGPIGLAVMDFVRISGGIVIALENNPQRLRFCKEKRKADFFLGEAETDPLEDILDITRGQKPSVVMDATGNLEAIETGFHYLAHAGIYVLVGLQKEDIRFSHPEFHKREATLMSSRNALRSDFERVMAAIKDRRVVPGDYITHRYPFHTLAREFMTLLDPANGVIKALALLGDQP